MPPRNRNTVSHLTGLRPDACMLVAHVSCTRVTLVAHVSCHTCNPRTLYLEPCRLLDLRLRLVDVVGDVRLLDSVAKAKT